MQMTKMLTQNSGPDYFDVQLSLDALNLGQPFMFPPMDLTHAVIDGTRVVFAGNATGPDPVQDAHREAIFYEADELVTTSKLLPDQASVLDVGANVGNHALYFALIAGAARVVVVEPNPLALAPLLSNIVLNHLHDVIETGALGVGLGATSQGGFGMARRDHDIGATRMDAGAGAMEIHSGDTLFDGEHFDLIKIDVEGMELDVLAGLEATIALCRPILLIDISADQDADFAAWTETNQYDACAQWRTGPTNRNVLLQPQERATRQ